MGRKDPFWLPCPELIFFFALTASLASAAMVEMPPAANLWTTQHLHTSTLSSPLLEDWAAPTLSPSSATWKLRLTLESSSVRGNRGALGAYLLIALSSGPLGESGSTWAAQPPAVAQMWRPGWPQRRWVCVWEHLSLPPLKINGSGATGGAKGHSCPRSFPESELCSNPRNSSYLVRRMGVGDRMRGLSASSSSHATAL